MHWQCFRMFSHLRIASGTAQNGNTSATKTMGQEIMKLLPEVYLAPMLAGNWSKMRRQCIRMFSHFRIASGTAQNGNTSATKTTCQEIVKLLPECILHQCPPEIDPKCIGSVSECSPTSGLRPARPKMAIHRPQKQWVKKLWNCCRKYNLKIGLPEIDPKCNGSVSECFPSSGLRPAQPKMAIQRPQKQWVKKLWNCCRKCILHQCLPEIDPKCVGSLSEPFATSGLRPARPKMAIHRPQKSCVKKSWKRCRKCILQQCLPEHYPKCIGSLSNCFPTSGLHPARPKMVIHRPQK